MPSEHMASPDALRAYVRQTPPETQLWPRPDSEHPGELVFGESCENKRHFDCIGLVNWVMWSIFHTRKINDIAQCQTAGLTQARQHPELSQTIEAGDILIYGINHIGIAVDGMHMVEATGAHWGVERNGIRRTGLTAKLRPTDSILRGRWDVRG